MQTIGEILSRDLSTPIEEVVKVSQQDDKTVHDEIHEYVATKRIKEQYLQVLEPFANFRSPTERIGFWVSGFFGSGKSSFIKNLGYILGNRRVLGKPAGSLFQEELQRQSPHDPLVDKVSTTLNVINRQLPILVLMFDVQVDLPAGATGDPLARIMYTVLLRELDYADNDYAVAELEIELEQEGRLADFVRRCAQTYGQDVRAAGAMRGSVPGTLPGVTEEEFAVWRMVRRGASRLDRVGRLLHEMDPATYPENNSWVTATRQQPDVTVGLLVDRAFELAKRRRPGHGIVFIMDEVGQYVGHSGSRLENLRAIVEQFGQESKNRVGRLVDPAAAPVWLVVTSQEKLEEVVSAAGTHKVEIAKVQDRFPTRIDMAPADIREVATKRVLQKNAAGAEELGRLYDRHGALLKTNTRLERTAIPHETQREQFITFYPYLPHFIDLSIDIVSGIRGRGEAPRHIGGSNRTIIKQAYEMLVGPRTGLKDQPVGTLVTLDRIYELVEGNLPSETRKEVSDVIEQSRGDEWPARVAKALALLGDGKVSGLPRTEQNVAALLVDRIDADSPLEHVRRAIDWLKEYQFIGQDQSGWKLLTAAEKHWKVERDSYSPTPREQNEILSEQLRQLFQGPALNAYTLSGKRTFRVRAEWNGRLLIDGNHIQVQLRLADGPEVFNEEFSRAEKDSHEPANQNTLYWAFARSAELDDAITEVARSANMVARYTTLQSQSKIGDSERASLESERTDRGQHEERLRAALGAALAGGRGVFRGVQRNGGQLGGTVDEVFRGLYAFAVPDLYNKLDMGVRKDQKNDDADKILKAANLNGLPAVFYGAPNGFDLVLKRDGGKFAVYVDAPLLRDVRNYIDRESNYGNKVTGKGLEEHFGNPPYGWESRTLMLALATLLRAGSVVVTYQGRRYRDHLDPQVHHVFDSATPFRSASFAPRATVGLPTLVAAAKRFESISGETVDIEETAIAAAYKALAEKELDRYRGVAAVVRANQLPGQATLDEYSEMLESLRVAASDEVVQSMAQEGTTFEDLRARANLIAEGSQDKGIARQARMRAAVYSLWPALQGELDGREPEALDRAGAAAAALKEIIASEAVYRPDPGLDERLRSLEEQYGHLYVERHEARAEAYARAADSVREQPEWNQLPEGSGEGLLRPLSGRDHKAHLPPGETVCPECRASLGILTADLSAAGKLQAEALARLRELTAPPEVKVERVRLSDVIGLSPSLSTEGELDALLRRLDDKLRPLIEAQVQVVLE